jgi:hypothetical protein
MVCASFSPAAIRYDRMAVGMGMTITTTTGIGSEPTAGPS